MKYKSFVFLFITALLISIYNIPSFASGYDYYNRETFYAIYGHDNSYYLVSRGANYTSLEFRANGKIYDSGGWSTDWSQSSRAYSSVNEALIAFNIFKTDPNIYWYSAWTNYFGSPNIFILLQEPTNYTFNTNNIENVYGSYEDYEETLIPPDVPWYVELWNDFTSFIDDNLISILEPWQISSILNLSEWFSDAWTVKVGEGEDALALALASPTPAPTLIPIPTQIPYQTVMSPDGNGGYTINYIYNNPQGTPIITSSPPSQAIPTGSINITDNDFEYPYYENPENKDNPFEFKIPWYLKLILNDNEIDIDSLDANYKVAQSQVQSDNIMDAVSSIYDGFQILPSGWLLILGAIASLPLIAALIHRMLNG